MRAASSRGGEPRRIWRWVRRSIKGILACLLAALLAYGGAWFYFRKLNADIYQSLPVIEIPASRTALLIAPHCDDEVLTNSILTKRLIEQGTDVHYVIISNGDGFTPDIMLSSKELLVQSSDYIRLGLLRQHETIAGLSLLGIPENHIRFFGYPDRGCRDILLYHWRREAPYFDPWTKSSVVPYPNSYGEMPALAGENMLADLERAIREVRPDLILMPHPSDQNADHATVNVIAQLALGDLDMQDVNQILYLTHHALNTWPQQIFPTNAGGYLVPPREMLSDENWSVLPVSDEDKRLKNAIIAQYRSQLVVDDAFLHSFVRDNELFAGHKQPTLIVGQRSEAEIAPTGENMLVSGGEVGAWPLLLGGGQLVKSVHGEVSEEGFLHLMLVTRGRINPNDIHQMILLLGDGGGNAVQSTVTVQNGRAFETGMGFALTEKRLAGDYIQIAIPYSELAYVKTLMISAMVSDFERVMSATVWQRIELPERGN